MRLLSDALCAMTFNDKISGDQITLFYRLPTPEEQIAYDNALVERKRNRIISKTGEVRQKYGRKILAGIGERSFAVPGKNGKPTPLSSDPEQKGYHENWKALVEKYAPDVVSMLAFMVFEQSLERDEPEDSEEDPL